MSNSRIRPNRPSHRVTIDQFTQPSNFHFVVADCSPPLDGIYGTRVFFHSPTTATKEILNRLSMWGGPDKKHWDDESINSWEFTPEGLVKLATVVLILTGEDLMAQLTLKESA